MSRLAVQDHAELLEEEHKGTAVLPGNTPSPAGNTALNHKAIFQTVIPRQLSSHKMVSDTSNRRSPDLSYLVSVEKQGGSHLWAPSYDYKDGHYMCVR